MDALGHALAAGAVQEIRVFIGVAQEKAKTFNGKKVNGWFEFERDKSVYVVAAGDGVAQEKAKTFNGKKVNGWFEFERDKSVYVNHYYFYIDDEDFGPLFIKICSYAPWSMKLCLNGHEWAKRQLEKKKIAYEALDNGFLSCAEPEKLQQICDSLGPEDIDRVFRKWLRRIPLPLRPQDREAGYDWTLSIWQMEGQLDADLRSPSAWAGALRRGHSRQSGSGAARPCAVDLWTEGDQENAGRVSHPSDTGRGASQSAHPIQEFRPEAVLQRRPRLPDRGDVPERG